MAIDWGQYEVNDKKEETPEKIDWEQYAVSPEKSISDSSSEPKKEIPFLAQLGFKLAKSFARPTKETAPERFAAMGRGFQDIGEGLKQLYLNNFGDSKKADDYTKKVEAERKFYEDKMPHDIVSDTFRSGASSLPYLAGAPETLGGSTLLKRMLAGGATGAGVGGSQFVPENESRIMNAISQGAIGASIPFAAKTVEKLASPVSKTASLPSDIKTLFSDVRSPRDLAIGLQKAHDEKLNKASSLFDEVQKEVYNRGISNIEVPENLLDQISEIFPKSRASKKLINDARNGDYKALRDLQSDLWKRGTKAKNSDLAADRNQGEELLDIRDQVNEAIANKFKNYGHADLNEMLNDARNGYRDLKETYYDHPAISKLVDPDIREIPTDPIKVLSKESKFMNQLLEKHPDIAAEVKLHNEKFKVNKKLKKASIYGGIGGTAIGVEELYRNLFGE